MSRCELPEPSLFLITGKPFDAIRQSVSKGSKARFPFGLQRAELYVPQLGNAHEERPDKESIY